jgi:CRISPR system Cascade subunit CasB
LKDSDRRPTVYGTVKNILAHLGSPEERKSAAANLAALRNSAGKEYEEASEVWPILFPFIPMEFTGKGSATREEKAVYVTLQLYAIGQQGTNKIINTDNRYLSMGASLRAIRGSDSKALDRRFNTMITATTFEEFVYHLRQIYKLGKSSNGFAVNFPQLGNDLYWYQNGENRQVCLKWAKDYYQFINNSAESLPEDSGSKDNQEVI